MKTVLALVAFSGVAASAFAGSITNTGTLNLYGNNYSVKTWGIAGDAGAASTAFGAEGMTFYNGTLYVSHDHDANRAAGKLVKYTPTASGNLSSSSTVAFGSGPSGTWGPEGITVNTSGAGYGSFAANGSPKIVAVETRGTDAFGVFDTGVPGTISNALPIDPSIAADDIAWTGSLNKFATVVEGPTDTSFLRFLNSTTMAVESASYQVINGAKGIATVSAAFAAAITGQSVLTSEAFLVVSEFDGFAFFDTNGNMIGSEIVFSGYSPIVELESVAVDEVNNLIFLGDEAGLAIHVIQVPAPSSLALLCLAGLATARRRR
jgi:hypothetical protein